MVRPGVRVNSARACVNSTLLRWPGGAFDTTFSSAFSPRIEKSRRLIRPACGALSAVGGSITTHIFPPTMRGYTSVKRNSAPASLVSKYITWRPFEVRVRMSPISAVSRPILAFKMKLRTRPLRRDIRRSRPRSASPWCPATTPTLISRSMSACLPLLFGSLGGPDIDDFTKVRPSYTSPRSTTRSAPSDARSARNVTLSPSEVANTGKFALCMSPLASSSTPPLAPGSPARRSAGR